MIALTRRLAMAAAACLAIPAAASAAEAVTLLQVVGPRDTVVIGITADERAAWGRGEAVTVVAERLHAAGTITVWQYAVGRAADGSLQMQPRARIALLRHEAVRIEPYSGAHPVVAPPI
jgi:hypothetical protein